MAFFEGMREVLSLGALLETQEMKRGKDYLLIIC